jgi:hypothetical protein
MLSFEEFTRSPKCRPFILAAEDEIQDRAVYKAKEKEFQEEQYDTYVRQFEAVTDTDRSLSDSPSLRKALHNMENGLRNGNQSLRKEKWNKYMREYRRRPKYCPHCKKQI